MRLFQIPDESEAQLAQLCRDYRARRVEWGAAVQRLQDEHCGQVDAAIADVAVKEWALANSAHSLAWYIDSLLLE